MITCIVPAYNEAKQIEKVIKPTLKAKKQGLINQIIVVSDGSTDNTAEVAKNAGADLIISYPKNRGKGYALLSGLKTVKQGDVLLLDADLVNLDVNHIKSLVDAIKNNETLMAIGFLDDNLKQLNVSYLSGQRIIKRKLVDKILLQNWSKSKYNIEILINRLAKKLKSNTVMIPLFGLSHIKKQYKYNNYSGFYHKAIFFFGLAKVYKALLFILSLIVILGYIGLIIMTPLKPKNKNIAMLPQIQKTDRILIVAAHPDDESIGVGGLIYDTVQKGAKVTVVVITSGDANKFGAGVMNKTILPSKADFIKEGQARITESKTALNFLGVNDIYFLGFPDRNLKQLLTKNWDKLLSSKFSNLSSNQYPDTYKPNSEYKGNELLDQLKNIILEEKPTIIITHMVEDKNTDHQATSKFTSLAVNELENREAIKKPVLYGFLIHYKIYEYPRPFKKAPNFPLNPPEDLQKKCSWISYFLSKTTQIKKEGALQNYHSQLKSPFLKDLIEAMDRTNELFCLLN